MKAGMVKSMTGLATALGLAGVLVLGAMSSYPVSAAQTAQGQGQAANASAAVLQLLGARPAATAGQSATQLPDGGWLLLGGTTGTGAGAKPSAGAWRVDPVKGGTTALGTQLGVARSGHTATLLPDGTVLVLGGTTASGVTNVAERFDPSNGSFTTLGAAGVLARSGHTATVLADGRVLVAGGVDAKGAAVREVEVYEPAGGGIERVAEGGARQQHRATLLPEGGVLLWGGTDAQGQALPRGALYDAAAQRWSAVTAEAAAQAAKSLGGAGAPAVLESQPASGAAQVPVGQRLMLRFSKRMDVASLNAATVTVVGPSGAVKLDAVGVEGGVLLFVTPRQELLPDTAFTLFVQGAKDEFGQALPMLAIGFRTAAMGKGRPGKSTAPGSAAATPAPVTAAPKPTPAASAPVVMDEDERWIPGRSNYGGNWTSGRRHQAERTLPQQPRVRWALHGDPAFAKLRPADVAARRLPRAPQARMGEGTSVSGQVLRLNGKPLANVTLAIGERRTRTDANGEFTLRNAPSGRQILVIDGGTANNGEYRYGRYEYGMEVKAGEDNALPFVSWMTPLDTANTVTIASPTTGPVVLTNPAIPGLELRIPAGTVIRDTQGRIVTELSLTAIPVDQPPFPLPAFPVPVYFTVQPGGSHLVGIDAKSAKGAQLIYPNFAGSKPGTRVNFWDYDATERGWFMYGQGAVSADGKQVVPDPGVVIYEFTGAMIAKPDLAPPMGPPTCGAKGGDPVDLFTGLFLNEETDVVINDVTPISISRSFRPADDTSRSFGIGTSMNYDTYLVGDAYPYTYQYVILPDGGKILFQRVSPGGGYTDAVYKSVGCNGSIYAGAILKWDSTYPGATWSVTFKSGTVHYYPMSYNAADYRAAALIGIRDRNGNLTTLTRASGSGLTKVTSPNGRTVSLTYDSAGRISKITDDIAREWKYEYDGQSRLIKAIDPLNNFRQYTYETKAVDPSKSIGGVTSTTNMLTVVDKRGNTMVTNVFDDAGRVAKQTYADGTTMSFSFGTTTVKTPPRLIITCWVSGGGTSAPGTGWSGEGATANHCMSYGPGIAVVNQLDTVDERGTKSRHTFDQFGNVTKLIRAVGLPEEQTTVYNRDENDGNLLSQVDPLGRKTAYEYDALGNVTKTIRLADTSDASTTSTVFDSVYSLPTESKDANGHIARRSYDAFGNLTRIVDPSDVSLTFTHDEQGRMSSVRDGLGNTARLFYSGADISAREDALGNRAQWFFDSVGRLKSFSDPVHGSQYSNYDAMDRLTGFVNAMGGTLQIGYDANGNITTQTDELSNSRTYVYDKRNRAISTTDALQQVSSTQYEPGGHIRQSIDRLGKLSAVIAMDGLGRPIKVGYGASVEAPTAFKSTVTYTWDAVDRVVEIVDSKSGRIGLTYDGMDRVTSETSDQGTISYTYDAAGRRKTMTVAGLPTVRYFYDDANRLTQLVQDAGAANGNAQQAVTIEHDAAGRRKTVVLANGVTSSFTYDPNSQLVGISYLGSTGASLGDLAYTYDSTGRRSGMTGSLSDSISDESMSGVEYDANGRMVKRNGRSLIYDANGNLVDDGSNAYVWDERDRLIAVTGATQSTYEYDALDRRVSRTVSGRKSTFSYDGANVIKVVTGAETSMLLNGLGVDELYAIYGASQAHLLTDALGSTRAVLDRNQAIVGTLSYGAFGTTQSSGAVPDWQYAARENDGNGLYYYRSRYYRPDFGRFISEDPLGWGAGQSSGYSYVNGDPINFVDPDGLQRGGTQPPRLPPRVEAHNRLVDNDTQFRKEFAEKAFGDPFAPIVGLPDNKPWCRLECSPAFTCPRNVPVGMPKGDGCVEVCTAGPFLSPVKTTPVPEPLPQTPRKASPNDWKKLVDIKKMR